MGSNIYLSRRARLLGLVGFFVLVFTGPGCAGTIQGQVLDAQTGQPIAGAVVLGVWMKVAGLPGLHHHELVGVEEVETDAEGRFILKRAKSIIHEDDESVTVYKFGYVAWNNIYMFPSSARRKGQQVPPQILLVRFPQGESHKRHHYFISDATWGKDDPAKTPRFSQAVRRELEAP